MKLKVCWDFGDDVDVLYPNLTVYIDDMPIGLITEFSCSESVNNPPKINITFHEYIGELSHELKTALEKLVPYITYSIRSSKEENHIYSQLKRFGEKGQLPHPKGQGLKKRD